MSRHLTFLRIQGWDPPELRAALCRHFGLDPDDVEAWPVVYQRYAFEQPDPPWTIIGPVDGQWSVYGSLFREEEGEFDDTEYDACKRAQGRLRDADPKLLRRLDFDPESAGTGIEVDSREDLENALRILGLQPPDPS